MRDTLVNNFLRVSQYPRKSGEEEKIADFFVRIAQENNLYCVKDQYNNVFIRKCGNINSLPIALQVHLDMVCAKSKDSSHDFRKDGIDVIIDGDKVMACDTSLGADQGVGLAILLTIMEDDKLKHPDLEFILTTEEETSFNGAENFPYSEVLSKRLINLDNSNDNSVFIGADGDICNEYSYFGVLCENKLPSYRILIEGFPGGNSSEDINLAKSNAITTMAELLLDKDIYIKSIDGGISENDLATFCEVVMNTGLDVDEIFKDMNVKIDKIDNKLCFSLEDTKKILQEILDLKSGYIVDSNASANLGLIKTMGNNVAIYYVFRSMDEEKLEMLNDERKTNSNGFIVNEVYRDPVWKVDYESELLRKYKELYFREYSEYPLEKIWHGAIECSAIKEKIDGLDIISIGCNIEKYHTIDEVTYVSSWLKIFDLLVKFLELL